MESCSEVSHLVVYVSQDCTGKGLGAKVTGSLLTKVIRWPQLASGTEEGRLASCWQPSSLTLPQSQEQKNYLIFKNKVVFVEPAGTAS